MGPPCRCVRLVVFSCLTTPHVLVSSHGPFVDSEVYGFEKKRADTAMDFGLSMALSLRSRLSINYLLDLVSCLSGIWVALVA